MKKVVLFSLFLVLLFINYMTFSTSNVRAKTYDYTVLLSQEPGWESLYTSKITFKKKKIIVKGVLKKVRRGSSSKTKIYCKTFKTTKKTIYGYPGMKFKKGKAVNFIHKISRKKFNKKVQSLLKRNAGLTVNVEVKKKKAIKVVLCP